MHVVWIPFQVRAARRVQLVDITVQVAVVPLPAQ